MPPESISDHAMALRTLDPDAEDISDLEGLAQMIGQARVVCLGECAHFSAELTRLRDRLLRFLVRELGFTGFVLESGLPEGLTVDGWVHGGRGDLSQIARDGISYAFGRCAETHAQLAWMRAWNRAHPRRAVGFYGMDVPGWLVTPAPGVAACLARIPPAPGDEDLLAAADLGDPVGAPAPTAGGTGAPTGLAAQIAGLVARAEAAGDGLARQCARGAQAVVQFLEDGLYPGPGRNLRNEVMAENLRWILEREPRVLVGAHNVHLWRGPSFDATTTIAGLLGDELGDDLVVIGTSHGPGEVPTIDPATDPAERFYLPAPGGTVTPPPGTIDAVLDTVTDPMHLHDLRRTPAAALGGARALRAQRPGQTLVVDLDPAQAFDAVIHIRELTPAHGR